MTTTLQTAPPLRRISSVVRALDVLADAWSFLVLREAFFGVRRFDGFQRGLGIARNILSDRLDHLVAEGVLERRRYSERPPRDEYRLTEAGLDLYPAIIELMSWGDRWRPGPGGPPLALFDRATGARLAPCVRCATCGAPVLPNEVRVADGPGAGTEEPPPTKTRHRPPDPALFLRGRDCSVARALAVIGDRQRFRILRDAFFRIRRFDEFQASLGVARNILAERLRTLVAEGVLEKRAYGPRPDRQEYLLTPMGLDLYPTFLLLMVWGDRWRAAPGSPPLILSHGSPLHRVAPRLVDATTGAPITARSVTYAAQGQDGARGA